MNIVNKKRIIWFFFYFTFSFSFFLLVINIVKAEAEPKQANAGINKFISSPVCGDVVLACTITVSGFSGSTGGFSGSSGGIYILFAF